MTETPGGGRGQRAQSASPASPPEDPAATPPEPSAPAQKVETKRFRVVGPAFTDAFQVTLEGDKKPTTITTHEDGVEVPADKADALQEAAKGAGVKLKEVTD